MNLSIHPLAEEELRDGAVYYRKEAAPELGEAFVAEFERSVELLREHSQLGAPWRGRK